MCIFALARRNSWLRFGTKDYTFIRIYVLYDYTAMQPRTFVRCGITKGTRESFRLAGILLFIAFTKTTICGKIIVFLIIHTHRTLP
jgi:hypothetical protein